MLKLNGCCFWAVIREKYYSPADTQVSAFGLMDVCSVLLGFVFFKSTFVQTYIFLCIFLCVYAINYCNLFCSVCYLACYSVAVIWWKFSEFNLVAFFCRFCKLMFMSCILAVCYYTISFRVNFKRAEIWNGLWMPQHFSGTYFCNMHSVKVL